MAEKKNEKKEVEEKRGLWSKFITFCHGVKVEFKRVHWTSKKDLTKYSVATLLFVMIFSLFFYGVNVLYSFIHSLIG